MDEFWAIYPRRVAKLSAARAWARLTPEQQRAALEALPKHVEYWRVTETDIRFIPYPATWLNQGRWDDELYLPEPKVEQPKIAPGWWASDAGTLSQGRYHGIEPRPGESISEFRERVRDRMLNRRAG